MKFSENTTLSLRIFLVSLYQTYIFFLHSLNNVIFACNCLRHSLSRVFSQSRHGNVDNDRYRFHFRALLIIFVSSRDKPPCGVCVCVCMCARARPCPWTYGASIDCASSTLSLFPFHSFRAWNDHGFLLDHRSLGYQEFSGVEKSADIERFLL